jgi:eukaryotic-like serine/threonine-protein kinase
MECVKGCDLKTLLTKLSDQAERLPVELTTFIVHQICQALDYAHNKTDNLHQKMGIVHRDITPANILLSYNGEVKVTDFGIAKAKNKIFTTKDGVLKGKYEYMSPEQAEGKETDHRSDIFSVGILLHEMLTGLRLFRTESDTATLEKVKLCDICEPIELNRKISPRLNQITLRALQRDPNNRFPDAKTMQLALAELLYPASFTLISDRLSVFLNKHFSETIPIEHQENISASISIQSLYILDSEACLDESSDFNLSDIDLIEAPQAFSQQPKTP